MKHCILTAILFLCSVVGAKAEVDPNFYIYICFGQSNMEGNAEWEAQDEGVDSRFQMLATCDFPARQVKGNSSKTIAARQMGNWYTADCPIVSPDGKLGPTDYFGRTMVKELPDKKIGVIAVAMGGSPIEMFDKDLYAEKILEKESNGSTPWWATLANRHYGGNPYGRIIEMAKKAQEVGVIKGILLHQGCSNNGQEDWPDKVKKIYKDMLRDLGLRSVDVPIFVGETEYENMGGGCSWHNHVVAKIPEVIPTGHVVSAEGIPGNGVDPWHFSAAGYRTFGKRYAANVLEVMNTPAKQWTIDERLTGTVSDLAGKDFAIVNEAENKAFFGAGSDVLGYDTFDNAFDDFATEGYFFRVTRVGLTGRSLKLINIDGEDYKVENSIAYLNSQAVTDEHCSLNGLNGQKGYDILNGALWDIQYVDNNGWTLKNVGTGKYLKDATHPAKFDEPTYFTFCTLKTVTVTGIEDVRSKREEVRIGVYTLDGRKVNAENLRPGLYIVNGKKVVIK